MNTHVLFRTLSYTVLYFLQRKLANWASVEKRPKLQRICFKYLETAEVIPENKTIDHFKPKNKV